MRRKKGFTLLELIIVIIVIGILASIALPRYIRVTEKARTAEAKSSLSTIRSAQIRYRAQYGNYSNNIGNLDTDVQTKYFTYNATDGTTGYIGEADRTPLDFSLGTDYTIRITEDGGMNITPGTLGYLL